MVDMISDHYAISFQSRGLKLAARWTIFFTRALKIKLKIFESMGIFMKDFLAENLLRPSLTQTLPPAAPMCIEFEAPSTEKCVNSTTKEGLRVAATTFHSEGAIWIAWELLPR